MKRFTRLVCLLLVVSMMLITPVYAAEEVSTWSSSYFMRYTVCLVEIGTYTFRAWFDVTALRGMDELGASKIKIQRSSDGENWTTTKTFTSDDYTQLIDENTVTHTAYVTYTGTKGYYYRSVVYLWAKDDSGTASSIHYSETIKIGG